MTKKEKLNKKINDMIAKRDEMRRNGEKIYKIQTKIHTLLDKYANWKDVK